MSLTGLLCALLLSVVASTSTAAAFSPDGPRATGLPLVEVIGCRMINGNLVCDRSGTLLPNRLRRPKATVKPQKKTVRPVQRKSPSKKSNTARQAPPQNDEDVGTAADAESDDEAEDSGEVTCPPGWVPLDEPDEKGAVCEPESERSLLHRPTVSRHRLRKTETPRPLSPHRRTRPSPTTFLKQPLLVLRGRPRPHLPLPLPASSLPRRPRLRT